MAVLNSSRVNGYQNRLTAEFLLFVTNLAIGVSRMQHSLVQPREEQISCFRTNGPVRRSVCVESSFESKGRHRQFAGRGADRMTQESGVQVS
jgi:hypothetical protein